MRPMLEEPVMLKYRGIPLYFQRGDFETLKRFRENFAESWINCVCSVDENGYHCRYSFFGQQEPTPLEENGELDPTEIAHHLPEHIRVDIGQLLNDNDPFNYENWRSETGGKIIPHY